MQQTVEEEQIVGNNELIGREVLWEKHLGEPVDFMLPDSPRKVWNQGTLFKVVREGKSIKCLVIQVGDKRKVSIPYPQANYLVLFHEVHKISNSRFTIAELKQLPKYTQIRYIKNAFEYGGDAFWENTKAVAEMMYGYPARGVIASINLLLKAAGLPELSGYDFHNFDLEQLIIRVQLDIEK